MTTPKPEPMSAERNYVEPQIVGDLVKLRGRFRDDESAWSMITAARDLIVDLTIRCEDRGASYQEKVAELAGANAIIADLKAARDVAERSAVEANAEATTLRAEIDAERRGARAIRSRHGALPNETFMGFIDRLAAERSQFKQNELEALAERDDARRSVQKHVGDYAKMESKLAVAVDALETIRDHSDLWDDVARKALAAITSDAPAVADMPLCECDRVTMYGGTCPACAGPASKPQQPTHQHASTCPKLYGNACNCDARPIDQTTAPWLASKPEPVKACQPCIDYGHKSDNPCLGCVEGTHTPPGASKPGLVVGQRYPLAAMPVGSKYRMEPANPSGRPAETATVTANDHEYHKHSTWTRVLVSLPDARSAKADEGKAETRLSPEMVWVADNAPRFEPKHAVDCRDQDCDRSCMQPAPPALSSGQREEVVQMILSVLSEGWSFSESAKNRIRAALSGGVK